MKDSNVRAETLHAVVEGAETLDKLKIGWDDIIM